MTARDLAAEVYGWPPPDPKDGQEPALCGTCAADFDHDHEPCANVWCDCDCMAGDEYEADLAPWPDDVIVREVTTIAPIGGVL